jgi:transcriptional regulator with XRE-family HTH domain
MSVRKFTNDPSSPSRQRALSLALEGEQLHASLLKARQLQGLTQAEVAQLIGVRQPTIATFERYDNDPKLSTLYRYAHAVGATIKHSVFLDGVEIDLAWSDTRLPDDGKALTERAADER